MIKSSKCPSIRNDIWCTFRYDGAKILYAYVVFRLSVIYFKKQKNGANEINFRQSAEYGFAVNLCCNFLFDMTMTVISIWQQNMIFFPIALPQSVNQAAGAKFFAAKFSYRNGSIKKSIFVTKIHRKYFSSEKQVFLIFVSDPAYIYIPFKKIFRT